MVDFRGKDFVRQIASNVLYKRVDEKNIVWKEMCVSHRDIVYFYLSTNPIIYIEQGSERYYFRECAQILPKKEYILKSINCFFEFIKDNDFLRMGFKQKLLIQTDFTDATVESFKRYIYDLCKDKCFINNMLKMDKSLKSIDYSIWSDNKQISIEAIREFGLINLEEKHFDIAICFIWQMRSSAIIRRNMGYVRGKNISYFNAVRTVSTQIVAEQMNVSDIVVSSEWCKLKINNIELYGVLSNAAKGTRALDCNIVPSIDLQCSLTELHILDLVCFQQDHGPNNYNICYTDNSAFVCAFDNDNTNTFFPIGRVDLPLAGCNSIIDRNGQINRKYFSYELAMKILQTDAKELYVKLKPYLNIWQCHSVIVRLSKIKESVKSVCESNVLVKNNEWNEDYLNIELSGEYGETYLTKLMNKSELLER